MPSTGIAAAAGTVYGKGPYASVAGAILMRDSILLGAAIECLPTVSDQANGGMYEVSMFKSAINGSFVTGTGFLAWPQTALPTHSYYRWNNLKNMSRYIWLPTDPTD